MIMNDDEESIRGGKPVLRSKHHIHISSTPGRVLWTAGILGGFFPFFPKSCYVERAVPGVEFLILFLPMLLGPRLSEHSQWKRLSIGTALHDEGMVLEIPNSDLAVAVGAGRSEGPRARP